MWGGHDLTASTGDASASGNAGGGMACTHRLLDLPLFATVCAALGNAYAVAKGSHESIATILGHAESGWRAGLEFASPVTGRIAGALETPLKAVDDAVCVGLDYVEEKVPAVKLPPGQLYANARDSIRCDLGSPQSRDSKIIIPIKIITIRYIINGDLRARRTCIYNIQYNSHRIVSY